MSVVSLIAASIETFFQQYLTMTKYQYHTNLFMLSAPLSTLYVAWDFYSNGRQQRPFHKLFSTACNTYEIINVIYYRQHFKQSISNLNEKILDAF